MLLGYIFPSSILMILLFFLFFLELRKSVSVFLSFLQLLHYKNISENSVENDLLVMVVIRGCGEIGLLGIDFYEVVDPNLEILLSPE